MLKGGNFCFETREITSINVIYAHPTTKDENKKEPFIL